MSKIRIGIVGLGTISGSHISAYMKRDDVELVAFADIDVEKAKAKAEQFNVTGVEFYSSLDELLKKADVDAIDVCTWPAAHAEVAIKAANAGKHILCEKPTANNLKAALDLRRAVKKNGVIFELAVPLRYQKTAQYIRSLVDKGEFGEVFYGKTAYVRSRGIPGGWYSDSRYGGGGPVIDIGVHRIDLAWYLMGCPKPVSISSHASYRIGDYRETVDEFGMSPFSMWSGSPVPDYKFSVEDSASGFIRFENNATLFFETSWNFNGSENNSTYIAGDKLGASTEPFKLYRPNGYTLAEEIPEGDFKCNFYELEIDHFIECIKTGKTPSSDIEQAVQLQAMLSGIYESSKKNKEIKLKY